MSETNDPTLSELVLRELETGLAHFKIFEGDQPSRRHLLEKIDALIKARITEALLPFVVCNTDITDEDYERLLKAAPIQYKPTPVNPKPEVTFIGQLRPTCAQCGAMMVDGLCSLDAAHYQ
jgi:hypothetical protein